jgi:hypothetical protein
MSHEFFEKSVYFAGMDWAIQSKTAVNVWNAIFVMNLISSTGIRKIDKKKPLEKLLRSTG